MEKDKEDSLHYLIWLIVMFVIITTMYGAARQQEADGVIFYFLAMFGLLSVPRKTK